MNDFRKIPTGENAATGRLIAPIAARSGFSSWL
jgi:hypothetical protein